jgi:sugar phosphate isomerase/epimerase
MTGAAAALAATGAETRGTPVCLFSKHLHWTSVADACKITAELGFDGMDLTVRKAGHIEPERVADLLPKAVDSAKQAGTRISMITAGIVDATTPHAEAILKTASALGIRHYRWGGFRYDTAKAIPEQIHELRAKTRDLAALNQKYGMVAMYHTHSGRGQFGASFWDLHLLLRDLPANAVSVNYDVGHAHVEGGLGGWVNSTRLLMPITRGIAVKDFYWDRDDKGKWRVHWCALGKGMVNLTEFLGMARAANFSGPIQLHYEYDELGGADTGKDKITIDRKDLIAIFRRDLGVLRSAMKETGLG